MAPPDPLIPRLHQKDLTVNALSKAQSAYRNDSQPIRTDRGTEYEAFVRVTHRLKAAGSDLASRPALAAALHENRRLWVALAADAIGDRNALPSDLRARIVYLAEFTRQHSRLVLQGASQDPLVEINTAIMRGLRQEAYSR